MAHASMLYGQDATPSRQIQMLPKRKSIFLIRHKK